MTLYLTGFLIAVFFPLFVSSWRVAFLCVALQGLCTLLVSIDGGILFDLDSIVQIMDIICLRFIGVPLVFLWVLRKVSLGREFDLIPANLVTWIIAVGLLILSLSLGPRLYPENLTLTFHAGSVAGAFLVALLILSVQEEPLGQMIGLLFLESALRLFESLGHREPWFIQIATSFIFLWLLVLMGRFVQKFSRMETGSLTPVDSEVL